jgi:hypothetical protein
MAVGTTLTAITPATAEAHIRRWLASFVVGLNLCPFARPLLGAGGLRIAVCNETSPPALRQAFLRELDLLQRSSEETIATTLLAFPAALGDFDDYLDFLDEAQALLTAAGLEGVVQLASFHPHYLFAGEAEGAASHYSNRSPYPLIHLLRESMLTRALQEYPQPEKIPANNIRTLEQLGVAELEQRWQALFSAAEPGS